MFNSVDEVNKSSLVDKNVVVIDALRATSVIVTAVNNGAVVIPILEIEEALKHKDKGYLLGGERRGLKIEGFDLGNSPFEYKREIVEGRKIIFTTTNGTRAIYKAFDANNIYIASMLNGKATARKVVEENKDTVIICAGTYGRLSLDDFICAGKVIYEMNYLMECRLDDSSTAAYLAYRDYKDKILEYVKNAKHYKYLISIGCAEDIRYCFTEDIIDVVPCYRDGEIKAAP
ncbi:putative 2-phosphosulfolactate phosphatase [Caloramator mitchellensis]|uniref:Probable 2-phosphosulfolactate phosphatase n=1 Tax=Caloramator mitchellensis TaxID=908809 RepID=A0A0R3K197_CALMK|nr:putative 2-phosphosulfolactate phosphatase [Caloramator mitchellensis]